MVDKKTEIEAKQEVQYFQLAKELNIPPDELKEKPHDKVEKWLTIFGEIEDYKDDQLK